MAKRLEVEFSDTAYHRFMLAAAEQGISQAEYLRRVLNIEDYLRQAEKRGAKILVVDKDGHERHIIGFSRHGSAIRDSGYQGSSDPGFPHQLTTKQTRAI